MKRLIGIIALLAALGFAMPASAQEYFYSQPVFNGRGLPAPGVNAAVCVPLATTAASVSGNLATLTMASNPATAGFTVGSPIVVNAFSGADPYFNGTFQVVAVTSTTITYPLTHANASASSNGLAIQQGSSSTGCAPLVTLYTDWTGNSTAPNPTVTDGLGNLNFYAAPSTGQIYVWIYGPTVGASLFPLIVPCVLGGSGCGGSPSWPLISTTANPASAGQIRLANSDCIDWNNAAGNANLPLCVNGSNQLTFNGTAIGGPCTSNPGSLQYDNSGLFGCAADFTFSGSSGIFDASAASAVKVPCGVTGGVLFQPTTGVKCNSGFTWNNGNIDWGGTALNILMDGTTGIYTANGPQYGLVIETHPSPANGYTNPGNNVNSALFLDNEPSGFTSVHPQTVNTAELNPSNLTIPTIGGNPYDGYFVGAVGGHMYDNGGNSIATVRNFLSEIGIFTNTSTFGTTIGYDTVLVAYTAGAASMPTNWHGFRAEPLYNHGDGPTPSTGTVANAYGYSCGALQGDGNIVSTNSYCSYFEDQGTGTHYGIYEVGTNTQNIFAGNSTFASDILPGVTNTSHLGSSSLIFANTWTGELDFAEKAAPSGTSGFDKCWGDSTLHGPKCSNNNGSALPIVFMVGAVTPGDCAQILTVNTLQDNGSACGTGGTGTVTAVSTGNAAPLFTAAITNPSTTPALAFTISNFAAHKFYGNIAGTTGTPAANFIGVNDLAVGTYAADTGSVNAAVVTLAPAATAYVAGLEIDFLPIAANTSSTPIINANSLGTKTITKLGTAALANGDLSTTAIAKIIYDGTEFQLINPQTGSGSGVTLQVNGINTSLQTTFNLRNTSAGGATTINFSNPSLGNVEAAIANTVFGGNAVATCTASGGSPGDYLGLNTSGICQNITPGIVPNPQTGTTYPIVCGDRGKFLTFNNASAIAVSIVSSASCGSNFYFNFSVIGAGAATFTPTTSSINGGSTLIALGGQSGYCTSDNTNYRCVINGFSSATSGSIGGAIVGAGCDTGTVTINGIGTGAHWHATANPNGDPGNGISWGAYVSGANTVTVKVCSAITVTPTSLTYEVTVQ